MTGAPTFSVVIPTRDRLRTLRETIPTVLAQTDGDFELIVQDNAGPPAVGEMLESLADPRIVHRRSDRLLPMHENWERALDAARGEYVIFIGDDDALLPDALDRARTIFAETGTRLLCWRPAVYHWPCHHTIPLRNLLAVFLGLGVREEACAPVLRNIVAGDGEWAATPGIYHGLVHRSVVAEVRRHAGGRYFVDKQPDLASILANLRCAGTFVRSDESLSLAGWSGDSNGGRAPTPESIRARIDRFLEEAGETVANWALPSDPRLLGTWTMILSTVSNARAALFPDDPELVPDERKTFLAMLRSPDGAAVPFDDWKAAMLEAAARLGVALDPEDVPHPAPSPRPSVPGFRPDGRLHVLWLDGDALGFATLTEATRLTATLLRDYRNNPHPSRA